MEWEDTAEARGDMLMEAYRAKGNEDDESPVVS
jgi:hypothetical protein